MPYLAYVANRVDNSISVINLDTLRKITDIDLGALGNIRGNSLNPWPSGVAFDSNNRFAYVTNAGLGNVAIINVSTGSLERGRDGNPVTINVGQSPGEIISVGDKMFVVNEGSNTVSVIATNNSVSTLRVGELPRSISASADSSLIYVANQKSRDITVINNTIQGASVNATRKIALGSFTPSSVALTPNGRRAYVACQKNNAVLAIDTATGAIVKIIPIAGGPVYVAVSFRGDRAYIANWCGGSISIIDTNRNIVIGDIPTMDRRQPPDISTGKWPLFIYFQNYTNQIYIVNEGSDDVSVLRSIKTALPMGTLSIPVGMGPVSMDITSRPIGNLQAKVKPSRGPIPPTLPSPGRAEPEEENEESGADDVLQSQSLSISFRDRTFNHPYHRMLPSSVINPFKKRIPYLFPRKYL